MDLHEPGLRNNRGMRRNRTRNGNAHVPLRKPDEEKNTPNDFFVAGVLKGREKQRDEGSKRKGRIAMRKLKTHETFSQGKSPLVVKGSLPRVFLGLGVFMEAGLLFCGSYLLADAILQPLDAGTFSGRRRAILGTGDGAAFLPGLAAQEKINFAPAEARATFPGNHAESMRGKGAGAEAVRLGLGEKRRVAEADGAPLQALGSAGRYLSPKILR